MVIRGIAVKNYPDPMGGEGEGRGERMARSVGKKRVAHAERGKGEERVRTVARIGRG